MGKTSLATNIAFNIAKAYKKGTRPDGSEGAVEGGVVGFFSLEMSVRAARRPHPLRGRAASPRTRSATAT